MSDEGPLTKLLRGLGLDADLAPIAAIKRIAERPVRLNPETLAGNKPLGDFEMAPSPELMSDTGVHRLYGDELIRRSPKARAFDLSYDYASYRPEGERWVCIDLNTYDGAEDAQAPSNFIGRGSSEKQARMDLLEQFAEHDETPRPKPSRVIHSSQFEPPTYADREPRDRLTEDDE